MIYTMERVTQPEIEPVTLEEMKRHSKAFEDMVDEDPDFLDLITEAREWVEDYTGRALIDQTWRQTTADDLNINTSGVPVVVNASELILHRSPVLSLVSVSSVDANGVPTVIDPAGFHIREGGSKWPRLVSESGWSGANQIVYRAGFADRDSSPVQGAEVVPKVFKRAIKLIATHYYTHREPIVVGAISSELALTIKWLLFAQRAEKGFA